MNDLDFCLEVVLVSRSCQPLRYIWRWISRKPLEIEVWFRMTTNRKWHMGYRMVTWPMTSRDLERSNSWPQYALSAISRKLLELKISSLVCSFVSGMPSGHINNFPESGRGLGHVTPTIFGSTVGYPSDSLASCCMIHPYDRQTDGRAIAYTRYIHVYAVARKNRTQTGVYWCRNAAEHRSGKYFWAGTALR